MTHGREERRERGQATAEVRTEKQKGKTREWILLDHYPDQIFAMNFT